MAREEREHPAGYCQKADQQLCIVPFGLVSGQPSIPGPNRHGDRKHLSFHLRSQYYGIFLHSDESGFSSSFSSSPVLVYFASPSAVGRQAQEV